MSNLIMFGFWSFFLLNGYLSLEHTIQKKTSKSSDQFSLQMEMRTGIGAFVRTLENYFSILDPLYLEEK
jgi:hypothetical protein